LGRRGQVQELIQMGQRLRSDVDWEPVPPELAPLIPMAVEVIAAPPDRTKVTPPPEPSRPPQVAGFVGREAELTAYADRLVNEQLAVIAGMAGVGKTALAVTLAQRVADPEHTFWHTFHEGEGVDALLWKLAGFLAWRGQGDLWRMLKGAQQSGGQPPLTEALLDYLFQTLRGRGYTLCLDDWHLVEEDPLLEQLVERMYRLVRAGELALIVTSRRAPVFTDETAFEPLAGLCASDTQALPSGRKADASNWGTWVDVGAPFRQIRSITKDGGYDSASGTSFSAPFVRGLVGVLMSNYGWSRDKALLVILASADNVDALNPTYQGLLGAGRINADRASAMVRNVYLPLVMRDF
jgi:hypothetical protein